MASTLFRSASAWIQSASKRRARSIKGELIRDSDNTKGRQQILYIYTERSVETKALATPQERKIRIACSAKREELQFQIYLSSSSFGSLALMWTSTSWWTPLVTEAGQRFPVPVREDVPDPLATVLGEKSDREGEAAASSSLALDMSLRVLARLDSLGGQPNGGSPSGPPSGPKALYRC